MGRIPVISSVAAFVLGAIALASNLGGAQTFMCGLSWFRSVCSIAHLGNVAASDEQAVWNRVSRLQTCDGYREYMTRYGHGEFVGIANARLTAARRVEKERWRTEDKLLPLSVLAPIEASPSEAEARTAALVSGRKDATAILCRPYAAGEFRLIGVSIRPEQWNCAERGVGFACGFDGEAVCHVQTRTVDVVEDCSAFTRG